MTRRQLRVFEPFPEEGAELALPVNKDDFDVFTESLDGRSWAADWKPIEVEIVDEDGGKLLQRSDSPWLGSDALILRPSAVLALAALLNKEGEFLPLRSKDVQLVVFNPTNRLDALDEARSELTRFQGGAIMAVERHVFRPEIIGEHTAFKIASLRVSPTYVTQEVVDAWKRAGLRGLDFKLLWED